MMVKMETSTSLLLLLLLGVCLVPFASAAAAFEDQESLEPTPVDVDEDLRFHPDKEREEKWQAFKDEFEKSYTEPVEEDFRKKVFMENLKEIESHNELYAKGLKTYTMGVNQFADLELSEFLKLMTQHSFENATEEDGKADASDFVPDEEDYVPPTWIDWRRRGYVTRVQNQGNCGSPWAFSATGSLEGQYRRKTGRLVELSEQNLIDCSGWYGNHGCSGGLVSKAFNYIIMNGGIDTEKYYPYLGRNYYCRYSSSYIGARMDGFRRIRGGESALQRAVAYHGPISVSTDVKPSFRFYKSGIYYEPYCSSTVLNHAMLAVGYGRTYRANYWIVKNSWGRCWGSRGYVYMARFRGNNCGIATRPMLPLV